MPRPPTFSLRHSRTLLPIQLHPRPNPCVHTHVPTRLSSTSPTPPLIQETNLPAPHTGSIRILSLCRPTARNALSLSLLTSLRHHIDALHSETSSSPNTTRALILASSVPGVFCAGADLKERKSFTPPQTTSFLSLLRATLASLAALPIPTISAVAGHALGGGLELALTTHLRVFSARAVVGLPETRLGIIPGAGGTWRLPSVVGEGRARDMVVTGRRVGSAEAYFWGLCDRLVAAEDEVAEGKEGQEGEEGDKGRKEGERRAMKTTLEEARRLAVEICKGGPLGVRAGLKAVEGWRDEGASELREYENVVGTEDRDEALAAFGEKRRPLFKGR